MDNCRFFLRKLMEIFFLFSNMQTIWICWNMAFIESSCKWMANGFSYPSLRNEWLVNKQYGLTTPLAQELVAQLSNCIHSKREMWGLFHETRNFVLLWRNLMHTADLLILKSLVPLFSEQWWQASWKIYIIMREELILCLEDMWRKWWWSWSWFIEWLHGWSRSTEVV